MFYLCVGDCDELELDWSEPDGECAGVVLDQHAEEDNGQKILDGPGPGDMKISDEFFPKIIAAKYEDSHDNETSD